MCRCHMLVSSVSAMNRADDFPLSEHGLRSSAQQCAMLLHSHLQSSQLQAGLRRSSLPHNTCITEKKKKVNSEKVEEKKKKPPKPQIK